MSASVRQRIVSLSSVAVRPALLLLGLVSAGLALRHLGLDAEIVAAGQHGPLAFVGLAAAACAFGVPRQVVAYSGGLAFGFWPGATLALLAEVLGCIGNFYWARWAARAWTARWLARSGGRLERLSRFLGANAFAATLTLRLLPDTPISTTICNNHKPLFIQLVWEYKTRQHLSNNFDFNG